MTAVKSTARTARSLAVFPDLSCGVRAVEKARHRLEKGLVELDLESVGGFRLAFAEGEAAQLLGRSKKPLRELVEAGRLYGETYHPLAQRRARRAGNRAAMREPASGSRVIIGFAREQRWNEPGVEPVIYRRPMPRPRSSAPTR